MKNKEEIEVLAYEKYPDFETHEGLNDEQRCLRIGYIRGYKECQQQLASKEEEIENLKRDLKEANDELRSIAEYEAGADL